MKADRNHDLGKLLPASINADAATITAKSCNRLIGTDVELVPGREERRTDAQAIW